MHKRYSQLIINFEISDQFPVLNRELGKKESIHKSPLKEKENAIF